MKCTQSVGLSYTIGILPFRDIIAPREHVIHAIQCSIEIENEKQIIVHALKFGVDDAAD